MGSCHSGLEVIDHSEMQQSIKKRRSRNSKSESSYDSCCDEEGDVIREEQRIIPVRFSHVRSGSTVLLQSWMRKCQAQLRYKNEVSRAIFQGMEYMDEAALFKRLGEVSVVLDDMARTDGFLEDGMIATSTSTPVKTAPPVVARADVVFDMEFVKRLISDVRQKVVVEAPLVLAILKAVSKVFMPRPNICKAQARAGTNVTVIGWS